MQRSCGWLLLGAGLFNLLLAVRLKKSGQSFFILEKRFSLDLNKTWSFHKSDLEAQQWSEISNFVHHQWSHQEVWFSTYRRTLGQSYCALRASAFGSEVLNFVGSEKFIFNCDVIAVAGNSVTTSQGTFCGDRVVDARGERRAPDFESTLSGFQKFVGWELRFQEPHGLKNPVIMDVQVQQKEGYRFLYLLPWSATEILVEDTRYSLDPQLAKSQLRLDLQEYVEWRWPGRKYSVEREEEGCLPIPLEARPRLANEFGVRGGFFHPTTSYSLPWALRVIEELLAGGIGGSSERLENLRPSGFYFLLNRLLFLAAPAHERWKIFSKFYQLPESLIERFYSGRSSMLDKIKILSGKPPVSVATALPWLVGDWEKLKSGNRIREIFHSEGTFDGIV